MGGLGFMALGLGFGFSLGLEILRSVRAVDAVGIAPPGGYIAPPAEVVLIWRFSKAFSRSRAWILRSTVNWRFSRAERSSS
eukprot:1330118-Amorphochlora_amoeboformis.AAC.1